MNLGGLDVHAFENEMKIRWLIFDIPVPSRLPIRLSMQVVEPSSRKTVIVIVDPNRFLSLVQRPGGYPPEIVNGSRETWPNDDKYERLEEGFTEGPDDPIAPAVVWCIENKSGISAGFEGGATRTMWMLVNMCPAFPVSIDLEGGRLLHKLAGFQDTPFLSVAELSVLSSIKS